MIGSEVRSLILLHYNVIFQGLEGDVVMMEICPLHKAEASMSQKAKQMVLHGGQIIRSRCEDESRVSSKQVSTLSSRVRPAGDHGHWHQNPFLASKKMSN